MKRRFSYGLSLGYLGYFFRRGGGYLVEELGSFSGLVEELLEWELRICGSGRFSKEKIFV